MNFVSGGILFNGLNLVTSKIIFVTGNITVIKGEGNILDQACKNKTMPSKSFLQTNFASSGILSNSINLLLTIARLFLLPAISRSYRVKAIF